MQSDNNRTLVVSNLKKKFPNGKVAVDNLNLEMFSDQIFSLLGHNGAGKTTTISMISGMLTQSGGSIKLYGKESHKNKDFIKSKMGVCPQKNPIFMKLTVYEHLVLYSKIKFKEIKKVEESEGEPNNGPTKYVWEEKQKEIETLLKDIDLWDKKDNIASELSGGQKRKLCVAMAFIGGSEVILLDEPTSGMDTFARRHLWEMLKTYKSGRIIILTTHNMDEADYLGDRIGIMSSGKQVTCGSSMFLKNKFGVGYILNILKQDESYGSGILDKINEFVGDAELSSDYGLEMKIQLSKNHNDKLEGLFQYLEEHGSTIGIKEFGISLTTLEDVFLKVGNMFNEEVNEDLRLLQEKDGANPPEEANLKDSQRPSPEKDEYKQIPSKNSEPVFDQTLIDQVENGSLIDIRLKSKSKIWFNQLGALIKKRLLYLSRDKGGIVCEIVLPLILVIVGLALTKIELVQTSPKVEMNPAYLKSGSFRINNYSNAEEIADMIAKSGISKEVLNVSDSEAMQNHIYANPKEDDVFDFFLENTSDLSDDLKTQFSAIPNYSAPSVSSNIYYNVFYNTTYPNAPLVASSVFNDALFKIYTNNDSAYIKTNLQPMSNTIGIKRIDNTADSINISILFSLAFAFIPTSIILFFINERVSGAKYQQLISGMYYSAYWIANFIVDIVKVVLLES
jgi:ATP-binding cassette subfamily A (ABC1) protein 3